MTTTQKILKFQLDNDIITDNPARGIAQLAIDKGFDSLSEKQKYTLKNYLSIKCSGFDNSENPADCHEVLEGEDLLDAYEVSEEHDYLLCKSCQAEKDYHDYKYEKMMRE